MIFSSRKKTLEEMREFARVNRWAEFVEAQNYVTRMIEQRKLELSQIATDFRMLTLNGDRSAIEKRLLTQAAIEIEIKVFESIHGGLELLKDPQTTVDEDLTL